jgi:hypothetical protein
MHADSSNGASTIDHTNGVASKGHCGCSVATSQWSLGIAELVAQYSSVACHNGAATIGGAAIGPIPAGLSSLPTTKAMRSMKFETTQYIDTWIEPGTFLRWSDC